jgi:hypothetical protein
MAQEWDWWIEQMPSESELRDVLLGILHELQLTEDALQLKWNGETGVCRVNLRVPSDTLVVIRQRFGDQRDWSEAEFRSWFRAHGGWPPGPGDRKIAFEVAPAEDDLDDPQDRLPPSLSVTSELASNSHAWPVAALLAGVAAERLVIHADDGDRDTYASRPLN